MDIRSLHKFTLRSLIMLFYSIRCITRDSRMMIRRLCSSNTSITRLLRIGLFISCFLFLSWSAATRKASTLCSDDDKVGRPDYHQRTFRGKWNTKRGTNGGFYQISDRDVYVYSAFYDDRYRSKFIRIFGMQNSDQASEIRCRLEFEGNVRVELPIEKNYAIYKKWPSEELMYHAFYYGCGVPEVFDFAKNFTLSLTMAGSDIETIVPLQMDSELPPETRDKAASRQTVICVKAMWGRVNATRLIEWIEFNRLLGIKKIVIYDTSIVGSALRVLDYYVSLGLIEVIQFDYTLRMRTLMQYDPLKDQLLDDGLLLEQTYLVSMNDCYYRYKNIAQYVLVIDMDEIVIPNNEMTLGELLSDAESEKLNASAFLFQTAWHLEDFGVGNHAAPSYMHMQRYTRRSPVMQSQPKAAITSQGAIAINWHGSVTMPTGHGYQGNQYLPWQRYGFVHHFRKHCKYDESKCSVLAQMTEQDEILPLYRDAVSVRVKVILNKFKINV